MGLKQKEDDSWPQLLCALIPVLLKEMPRFYGIETQVIALQSELVFVLVRIKRNAQILWD